MIIRQLMFIICATAFALMFIFLVINDRWIFIDITRPIFAIIVTLIFSAYMIVLELQLWLH